MIKLIVAMSNNKLIGNKNKIPWNIKKELLWFRKTTMGHALLFGRTTYQSLTTKLIGRKIFVLSSKKLDNVNNINGNKAVLSLFKEYKNSPKILFIAGGKSVYEEYYRFADEIIVSVIKGHFQGDVYLNIDLSNYQKKVLKISNEFDIFKYTELTLK